VWILQQAMNTLDQREPADATSDAIRLWNVVFILCGLREDHLFRDTHYFLAPCTPGMTATFRKLGEEERCAPVRRFFDTGPEVKFFAAAFRIKASEMKLAHTEAEFYLHGLLDGLAPHVDHMVPKIGPFFLIAPVGDKDMQLFLTGRQGWAYIHSKEAAAAEAWKEREKSLFIATLPFFDIASGIHPHRNTPLARQLLYSMKMFRSGAESDVFGVEFLCKWSALEGLVCAGEKRKGELLRDRIPEIYPTSEQAAVLNDVKVLWKLRNEASHEARAFDSDYLEGSRGLAVQIESVERLFVGVVVFALAHINCADSVKSLWTKTAAYELPALIRERRPADMGRAAVTSMTQNTPFQFTQLGVVTDLGFDSFAGGQESTAASS
jgi:hypothetical protein